MIFMTGSTRRGSKRGREECDDDENTDGGDNFYGFAADSLIFAEDSSDRERSFVRDGGVSRTDCLPSADDVSNRNQRVGCAQRIDFDPLEGSSTRTLPDYSAPSNTDRHTVLRRSTRSKRFRKNSEFVYY